METVALRKPPKLVTGRELWKMGDIGPCELVKGRVQKMSITGVKHGFVVGKIYFYLTVFVNSKRLGWVLTGDVGIYTKFQPDTVRGADVVFISKKRLPELHDEGFLEIAPELIVEVLSPNDKRKNINDKIKEYLAIGVQWVWVVDPRSRTLQVYSPDRDVQTLTDADTLQGTGILEGFSLNIATIFED